MFRLSALVLLLAAVNISHGYTIRDGCTISVNTDITDPQPLILKPGTGDSNDAYYLPSSGDEISIAESGIVEVACPGGKVVVSGTATTLVTSQATCSSGKFIINDKTVAFSAITCSVQPVHTARFSGNACLSIYKEVEIGFAVGTRFIKHITGCFDSETQNTLYSVFDLTSTIGGYQVGYPRPGWNQGSFYSLGSNSLDTLYTRKTQRTTINALLGLAASSTEYIHATNDYYLSRGHLAAKADFLYGSQHRFTFYFVNAAPQWQTFNGGNWNTLEDNVRDLASSRKLDLQVYTGTHGVATLPHATTGEDTELYLYVSGTTKAIPVPKYYWKVAYNPSTGAGVAFVGLNNPYEEDLDQHTICTNICDQLSYLTWSPNNTKLGYSYCCTIDDLRKTVTNIPSFTVSSVLT